MNEKFKLRIDKLEPYFQQLISMQPVSCANLPADLPEKAIYLFSESSLPLYVGRTNNLRQRMRNHSSKSATHAQAPFASKLVRLEMGQEKGTYSTDSSRKKQATDSQFVDAFDLAKQRIRKMELRYVQVDAPEDQALLELYVAISLSTPYNDFNNH